MRASFKMSGSTQWILVWVALVLLAIIVEPAEAGTPVKAASNSFWDTDMRLCAINDQGKCNISKYAENLARFAIPGIVMAFLCFMFLIFFLAIRMICNGCGGRYPSRGICPGTRDPKRDYTRSQIIYVKIGAAVVIIPIIIAIGIGFESNSGISQSTTSIVNDIVDSGHTILSQLEVTAAALRFLTNDTTIGSVMQSAIKTARDIESKLTNAHDVVKTYDSTRQGLLITGFVVCLLLVVLGLVCAIFNLRSFAMALGLLAMLILVIVWLTFGLHLVVDKFVYDVCVDINILTSSNATVSNQTSVFKTGALAQLWDCNDNVEFMNLQSVVNQSIDIAARSACRARGTLCFNATGGPGNSGDPNWVCSWDPPCNANTVNLLTDSQHMIIMDSGVNRSVAGCAAQCTNSIYRNQSVAILDAMSVYSNYTDVYYNNVLPLISCQVAVDVFTSVQPDLCETMFDSIYGVAICCLILGIFFVPFIIFMVLGFKRFVSFDGGIV